MGDGLGAGGFRDGKSCSSPKAVGGHPMLPEMVNSEKSDYLLM